MHFFSIFSFLKGSLDTGYFQPVKSSTKIDFSNFSRHLILSSHESNRVSFDPPKDSLCLGTSLNSFKGYKSESLLAIDFFAALVSFALFRRESLVFFENF